MSEPRPTRSGQLPPQVLDLPLLTLVLASQAVDLALLPVVLPLAPRQLFPEPLYLVAQPSYPFVAGIGVHVQRNTQSSLDSPYSLTAQNLCHICAKSTIGKMDLACPPAKQRPQSVLTDVDIACDGLGRIGLSAPLTHLIDRCALTDPLLARLPALYTPDWRIGHLERLIPYGYEESVQQATNLIVNPVVKALYADLHVITRAPQLWSRARWTAIWRVNTGVHRRRIDRWFGVPGDVPDAVDFGLM